MSGFTTLRGYSRNNPQRTQLSMRFRGRRNNYLGSRPSLAGRMTASRGVYMTNSVRAAAYAAATNAKETKYFDTGIAASVAWAGTDWSNSEVPCLTYVNSSGASASYTDSALIPSANGSAYGQVDGNKYDLKALRIRGSISVGIDNDTFAANEAYEVRLLLVEDSQPNGAQAQGEDILQDIGGSVSNFHSFLRIPNGLGRFRILKDKKFVLQPVTMGVLDATPTANTQAFQTKHFKMSVKPNCQVTIKSGNATPTVAGLINKNYFLLAACVDRSSTATGVAVTIHAATRAYYKD